MIAARFVTGVILLGVGIGLAASPEIGGWVSIGFFVFAAGAAIAAGAVVDVLGVE